MNRVTSLRGAGLLLMAAIAWGGFFPVAMVTLPVLDPFHMTAIRYGITAIIFVGLLALAEGPRALKMEGRGLLQAAHASQSDMCYRRGDNASSSDKVQVVPGPFFHYVSRSAATNIFFLESWTTAPPRAEPSHRLRRSPPVVHPD